MTDMTLVGYLLLAAVLVTDCVEAGVLWLNVRFARAIQNRPPAPLLQIVSRSQLTASADYLAASTKARLSTKLGQMIVVYVFFLSGLLAWYAQALVGADYPESIKAIAMLFPFSVATVLAGLPGSMYRTLRVDKRFGLNRTTVGLFLLDRVRVLIISFVSTFVVLSILFAMMRFLGGWWWLWGAVFFCSFIAVLHLVYPTFIAPLFNRYRPLPDTEIRRRLLDMMKRAELPLDDVYVVDASRRSARQNASFSGFGRSRRIVLYDNLIENNSVEMVEATLAHEIGHCKRNHIARTLILAVPMVFLVFYVVSRLLNWSGLYYAFGMPISPFAGIFLVSVIAAPARLVFGAASSWLSRKHEYEADAFAAQILTSPSQLMASLVEMNRRNRTNPIPHPLYTLFFGSHPTLPQRIHQLAVRQFRQHRQTQQVPIKEGS